MPQECHCKRTSRRGGIICPKNYSFTKKQVDEMWLMRIILQLLRPSPAGKELKPLFCSELSPPLIQNILPFLSQPWWWVNTRSRWINPLEGDIWCRQRRSRSGRQLWTMEPSLAQIHSLPVILHPAVITNTQTDRNQDRLCCPKM